MLIAIIGENCTGKSTLADEIKKTIPAEIISGRDYLKMAKSESEAVALFKQKLLDAVSGNNIIYVITEPELVKMLPDGAVRILASADIDTIKERFKQRMHGVLPEPVARMLEGKHGIFDGGDYDYRYDSVNGNPAEICEALKKRAE
ncbi:MAG: ATP-binding protein [Clostridiales bacterium]|nr:ATP-binding protein [Clostridiales bacterium]